MAGPTDESSSGSNAYSVNFDDSLYIHPFDNSMTAIVTIKLNGTKNFRIWCSSMIRSLKDRNKLGFVNGTIKNDTTDLIKSFKWERVNFIVCSWILCSLSEFIYSSHAYSESAKDVWNELLETYNKSDGSVIFKIHQPINSLTHGGSSLSEYFNKIESLWKEFNGLMNLLERTCEAATKFNDPSKLMKLMQFLFVLDDSFNRVKSHVLFMDPFPNVKVAFFIISHEESHQKSGSFSSSTTSTSRANPLLLIVDLRIIEKINHQIKIEEEIRICSARIMVLKAIL